MTRNTKGLILKKAERFFAQFGFAGTSMAKLAQSLELTKPALYYHFKSKKALYLKVLGLATNNLFRKIKKSQKNLTQEQKLLKLIKNYLAWARKEKNLIALPLLRVARFDPEIKTKVLEFKKELTGQFEIVLRDCLKRKINIGFISAFLLATIDGIVLQETFQQRQINIEKISQEVLRFFKPNLNTPAPG